MKLMQRRATIAVAMTLAGASAPAPIEAQSRNVPGADTPRLLVVVFQSSDRAVGVAVADAVRSRISGSSNPRQLFVTPKEGMVGYLESSGYKADSSLGLTDLKELAKGLRADDVLGGFVSRKPNAPMQIEPRLMWAVDPTYAQPLPAFESTNLNDAGRQVERSYHDARKQMADFKACQNHIRGGATDKAIAAGRAGIAKYARATIVRICLANAFEQNKQPDSVLAITREILGIDPRSVWGPRFSFFAYRAKADAEPDSIKSQEFREHSVRSLVQMLAANPSDQTLQASVITELAKLGRPSVALPIVDTLLVNNPADPMLLRTRWLLLLAAASQTDSAAKPAAFDKAIMAGETWVRNDTSLADSSFFDRQIRAATGVTQERLAEIAAKATRRYPNNQDFWWYRANAEYRSGQLRAAQESIGRLLRLNPKYTFAGVSPNVVLGQIFLQQKMTDSAIALARRAAANGEDPKTWGTFLLQPTSSMTSAAQALQADTSKTEEASAMWEAVLGLAQEADKLNPQPTAKFFIGVSSFYVGANAYQKGASAQRLRGESAQRAAGCPHAKKAQDMFLLTQLKLPAGGSVSPATAQQLLGFVAQYAPGADEMVKRFCR